MLVKLTVNPNQDVFVFKNEKFVQVLKNGRYRFFAVGDALRFSVIDKAYPLVEGFEAEQLQSNSKVGPALKVLVVAEQERASVRVDGILKTLLGSGRYFYYDPENRLECKIYSIAEPSIDEALALALSTLPSATNFIQFVNIEDGLRGILYYNNRHIRILSPGQYYFWKSTLAVSAKKVDIRSQSLEIQGQELMTKDKVTLRVNLSVRYRVVDVMIALESLKDFADSFYRVIQMALREAISSKTLDELLTFKTQISADIANEVRQQCTELGMVLEDSGIRDIILPGEMKTILNQVIEAEKRSQANMIQRREETAATRSLLNTAKLLEDNPILLRLKELEASERIAEKVGSLSITGGFEQLFKAIQAAPVLRS